MVPETSILFSDMWASVGNTTFYHRHGKLFARKKSTCVYPGTESQLASLAVHKRALQAWRGLEQNVQLQWKAIARNVRPHRPPFDNVAHISGYNLFVSAYHGFAAIGMERTPEPLPFSKFPCFNLNLDFAALADGNLSLNFTLEMSGTRNLSKYRLLCKIQTDLAGRGKSPGMMKNYLSDLVPTQQTSTTTIEVPFSLETTEIQIHMRYLLIDSTTGYRSPHRVLSTCTSVK